MDDGEADVEVPDREKVVAAASSTLRDIVESYAKESVELQELRERNQDLVSANQVMRKREDDSTTMLDMILQRSLQTKGGEEKTQNEVEKLKTALQEIAELQEEFVSTAEEKRKHQLAMEMEIVGVVESFTDVALLRETEKDAVEAEVSLLKEVLKKRSGIDVTTTKKPSSKLQPLPEDLPRDLTPLFLTRLRNNDKDRKDSDEEDFEEGQCHTGKF